MATAPLSASADYLTFTTTLSTADPIRLVAQVMMGMSNAQGNLLRTMTAQVTALTNKMADVNELMGMLNLGLNRPAVSDESPGVVAYSILAGQAGKDEMLALSQRFIDAGATRAAQTPTPNGYPASIADSMYINRPADPTKWQLYVGKTALTNMSQNLQRTVDNISSEVQQAQLSLQTLMGRYNGAFEVVTSAIKKSETQSQSVTGNIRR